MLDRLTHPNDRVRLACSLHRGFDALLSVQRDDGHFCGELQGDSILQSEYLLMKFILGQEDEPHQQAFTLVTHALE